MKTYNVRFTKQGITFLKGYDVLRYPCGAAEIKKIRKLIKVEPYKQFKYSHYGESIKKCSLHKFIFSDGAVVYEHKVYKKLSLDETNEEEFEIYASYLRFEPYFLYGPFVHQSCWFYEDYAEYISCIEI